MFRSPSAPIIVPQAPNLVAGGATYGAGPPAEIITVDAGTKIYLTGCTTDGIGNAYYMGKKIAFRINLEASLMLGLFDYETDYRTNLNDGTYLLMGSDGGGVYITVATPIVLFNGTFGQPYLSGIVIFAMVYPDNSYPDWVNPPHQLPPAYQQIGVS